mgnify:CR=1 FL=1
MPFIIIDDNDSSHLMNELDYMGILISIIDG